MICNLEKTHLHRATVETDMAEQTERRSGEASWRSGLVLEIKNDQDMLIRIHEYEWHLRHEM